MSIFLMILGILLTLVVLYDFVVTVFIMKGEGFITEFINLLMSRFFKTIVGHKGENKLLDYLGLIIIISMVTTWILLVWFGITLIYQVDPNVIIHNETKLPANFSEKFYFVGYTLSTLGPGDYSPQEIHWQIITSLISFMGFVIITICITYIVPVINNILEKNTLSLKIASLGESTTEILKNAYNGKNFTGLSDQLPSMANDIFKHSKNHLAYPILHYVHNSDKSENTILKLASLDETLTILMYHVPKEQCPQELNLQQVRKAITSYLNSIKHVKPSELPPPLPDFNKISKDLNLSLTNIDKADIHDIYTNLEKRRCLLKGIVEDDGWEWKDLQGSKFKTERGIN
jgi:hypothetical protein